MNVVTCDTIKKCKLTRDAMEVIHELCKPDNFSPKCMPFSISSKKSSLPTAPVSEFFVQHAGWYKFIAVECAQ